MWRLICNPPEYHLFYHFPSNYSEMAEYDLTSGCNEDCECSNVRFQPVCSYDSVQYYSPCHAGCFNTSDDGGVTVSSALTMHSQVPQY